MTYTSSTKFARRLLASGTYDSICLRCYLTAVRDAPEDMLQSLELTHTCPARSLSNFERSLSAVIARKGSRPNET